MKFSTKKTINAVVKSAGLLLKIAPLAILSACFPYSAYPKNIVYDSEESVLSWNKVKDATKYDVTVEVARMSDGDVMEKNTLNLKPALDRGQTIFTHNEIVDTNSAVIELPLSATDDDSLTFYVKALAPFYAPSKVGYLGTYVKGKNAKDYKTLNDVLVDGFQANISKVDKSFVFDKLLSLEYDEANEKIYSKFLAKNPETQQTLLFTNYMNLELKSGLLIHRKAC